MTDRTIWKFDIELSERFALPLPDDYKVLKVSDGFMWIEGSFLAGMQNRSNKMFAIVGTGTSIPEGSQHVGTYFDGAYVWHVYGWKD